MAGSGKWWTVRALLVVVWAAVDAAARTATAAMPPLDCVIEPHSVVNVGSDAVGVLKEVLVVRGDRVRRGQVLARLEAGLETITVEIARARAKADAELLAGKVQLEYAVRKATRVDELFGRSVVSAETRDEALTDRRLAELAVREAEMNRILRALELRRAEVNLAHRTIRSPVNGIVQEQLLFPGEFAHEQSPLMTVAELDPLNVEVFAPVEFYDDVSVGMAVEVLPVAPVSGRYDAIIAVVDPVFDAASGTFGIRLDLPNPDFVLPAGLNCTAVFPSP